MTSKFVIDLVPWPQGLGFQGRDHWWKHVLGQDEGARINSLLLAALLSDEVCRLLLQHDPALLDAFHLSSETTALFNAIQASTLDAFASQLLERLNP